MGTDPADGERRPRDLPERLWADGWAIAVSREFWATVSWQVNLRPEAWLSHNLVNGGLVRDPELTEELLGGLWRWGNRYRKPGDGPELLPA